MHRIKNFAFILFYIFVIKSYSQTMEYRSYEKDNVLIDGKIEETTTLSNVWHSITILNDSVFIRAAFTKKKVGYNYFITDTFIIRNNMVFQKFCDTIILSFSKKLYSNDSSFKRFYRDKTNRIFICKYTPLDSIKKYLFFHAYYFNYEEYMVFGSINNCEITNDIGIISDVQNRLFNDPIIGYLGSGFYIASIKITNISFDKNFKRAYKKMYKKIY